MTGTPGDREVYLIGSRDEKANNGARHYLQWFWDSKKEAQRYADHRNSRDNNGGVHWEVLTFHDNRPKI